MKAFVTQLIQISHSQWIFWNYTLRDKQWGHLRLRTCCSEVLQEVHKLLNTALVNIPKESQYLLELDHSTLYNASNKRQTYWVLAMQAAQRAGGCTVTQERAQGGLQQRQATKAAGQRIQHDFSTLISQMQHELGLATLTRPRPHPTSTLMNIAFNKQMRKPD
jgi:hypothetical protein